jgi:pimeloyl-ACP methyl ester carboxylesterase
MTASVDTIIQPQLRTIDGLSIRYAESEPRDIDALLLCPWPESLFAFAGVWSTLARRAHLVAVDLPGFGHSERRNELLTPSAMGEFVVKIADAFNLNRPHAVGPDIGTAALLFAAARHPNRFSSLTVGTGGASYPLELGEPLTSWIGAKDLEEYRRIDPRQIVAGALSNITPSNPLPAEIREDYLSAYDGDRFVESMRYVRAYPKELPILAKLLPTIETPVLLITGSRDTAVPPSNAEYLHARLPNSRLEIVDTAHFVWEDNPPLYASLVDSWWSKHS